MLRFQSGLYYLIADKRLSVPLTRNVLVLMLLEVAVQVGLLAEAAVAQVTLEGLLLVVDVADVALQVGRDAEGAVAVLTPGGESTGEALALVNGVATGESP